MHNILLFSNKSYRTCDSFFLLLTYYHITIKKTFTYLYNNIILKPLSNNLFIIGILKIILAVTTSFHFNNIKYILFFFVRQMCAKRAWLFIIFDFYYHFTFVSIVLNLI